MRSRRLVSNAAFIGGILLLIILSGSCRNRNHNRAEIQPEDSVEVDEPEPLQVDRALNDMAMLFAGLPLGEDSPEYGWMEDPVWTAHKAQMDEMWAKCVKTLDMVADIRDADLQDIVDGARNVLYPFSGPDLPFMVDFFPSSETYYMMGLERTGTVITPEKAGQKTFQKLEQALHYLLAKSYFVTSYMASDLHNQEVDGTIPILMVLLSRMGYGIESVAYQTLTETGEWQDSEGHAPFVRIRFFKEGDRQLKTLYYLSTNLQDDKFDPSVQAMLEKLDPRSTATLVKSCSYLLHYGSFSTIREDILDHSFALIQDDTGVRYNVLLSENWKVDLYGGYVEPLHWFPRSVYQTDLAKVYQSSDSIKPLGFRFGYNDPGSSLIVARKNFE